MQASPVSQLGSRSLEGFANDEDYPGKEQPGVSELSRERTPDNSMRSMHGTPALLENHGSNVSIQTETHTLHPVVSALMFMSTEFIRHLVSREAMPNPMKRGRDVSHIYASMMNIW